MQESDGNTDPSAPVYCPDVLLFDAFLSVTAPGTVRYRIVLLSSGPMPDSVKSVDGPGEIVWRGTAGRQLFHGGTDGIRLEVLEPNAISSPTLSFGRRCSNAKVVHLSLTPPTMRGRCPMSVGVAGRIDTDMYSDIDWAIQREGHTYSWHSASMLRSLVVSEAFYGVTGSFKVRLITKRPSIDQSPWYTVSVTCTH